MSVSEKKGTPVVIDLHRETALARIEILGDTIGRAILNQ
jgi:hypothetical protein